MQLLQAGRQLIQAVLAMHVPVLQDQVLALAIVIEILHKATDGQIMGCIQLHIQSLANPLIQLLVHHICSSKILLVKPNTTCRNNCNLALFSDLQWQHWQLELYASNEMHYALCASITFGPS